MEEKKKVKKYIYWDSMRINAWQLHVMKTKKENPSLSLKNVLIKAKESYKKVK